MFLFDNTLNHWPLGDVTVILTNLIFIIQNITLGTRCEIALRWMSQNCINEKSTLFQVMTCYLTTLAIAGANINPDICCHLPSRNQNEFFPWIMKTNAVFVDWIPMW